MRKRSYGQRDEWKRQLDEVERAISKWQAAFEAGNATLEDVGIERLRELRKQKAELEEKIAKVVPIQSPPPHLYKAETIERFDAVREVFLAGKHEMTRTYLRLLADKIVLHGEVAEVVVRTAGAAALMAQGTSGLGEFTAPEAVLTSVKGWLRMRRSLRTLSVNAIGTDSYLRTDPRRRSRCDSENLRRERWDRFAASHCPIVGPWPRDRVPSGHVARKRAVPAPAGL